MISSTIRITPHAHQILRDLAAKEQQSMQAVLDQVLEQYRRQRFLEDTNVAFGVLRRDTEAWQEEQQEREVWEQTLTDDIE